jgi:hypothetical protein
LPVELHDRVAVQSFSAEIIGPCVVLMQPQLQRRGVAPEWLG